MRLLLWSQEFVRSRALEQLSRWLVDFCVLSSGWVHKSNLLAFTREPPVIKYSGKGKTKTPAYKNGLKEAIEMFDTLVSAEEQDNFWLKLYVVVFSALLDLFILLSQ